MVLSIDFSTRIQLNKKPLPRYIIFEAAGLKRRSRVTGHGSQVTGHRSRVTGHGSQVTGHRSRVTGHRLLIINFLL